MKRIKKGDEVIVIAGRSKGTRGTVLETLKDGRLLVDNVNMIKKHVKPSANNPQGSIEEREGTIHISNLMLIVNGEATKTGKKHDDKGKLIRYSKKSGEVIK